MADPGHGGSLLLPFDVDDPEFVRGFECGRVWANLRAYQASSDLWKGEDDELRFTVHWSSAEMMMRIGEALEMTCRAEHVDDETFCEVVFDA